MTLQPTVTENVKGEGEILLVDKPLDWTSFDVVNKIRMLLHVQKAGHAGTLDPKASGLLIVCTGRQTKIVSEFVGMTKEYTGCFKLGIQTPSFDAETEIIEKRPIDGITEEQIRQVFSKFVGKQKQVPPMFSAVKHRGKPLYKLARKGRTVERQAKEVEVMELDLTEFSPPVVALRVVCSKGTYIRALVNDIGLELGCGASLTSLRRTKIGPYRVEDAMTMDQLLSGRHSFKSRLPHESRSAVT